MAEGMKRRGLSFHRGASASLPLGDEIEIAFSDLPVKLTRAPSPPGPPPLAVISASRTAPSLHGAQLSRLTMERLRPQRQPRANSIGESQPASTKVQGTGLQRAGPGRGWCHLQMTQLRKHPFKVRR